MNCNARCEPRLRRDGSLFPQTRPTSINLYIRCATTLPRCPSHNTKLKRATLLPASRFSAVLPRPQATFPLPATPCRLTSPIVPPFQPPAEIQSLRRVALTLRAMFSSRRNLSVSGRARTEAYAGLFLLVLALTVLAFNRCNTDLKLARQRQRPPSLPLAVRGRVSPDAVAFGNALRDGHDYNGWWVGHFVHANGNAVTAADNDESNSTRSAQSARRTHGVEAKWIEHKAGKKNRGFATNRVATSMAVLVSGRHRIEFEDGFVVLEYPGDYVIWKGGVAHSWTALEDTTMMCVRWPSLPGDQMDVDVGVRVRNISASRGGGLVGRAGVSGEK